jgi:hypothetical protein
MTVGFHITLSAMVSSILFVFFKSWVLSLSSFITGFLIDIDHLIDYWREYGFRINVKEIFSVFTYKKLNNLTMYLHGWEWLILLCMSAWLTNWNLWVIGILTGYAHHIFTDQIGNKPPALGYFLFWRWKKGFLMKAMYPEGGRCMD